AVSALEGVEDVAVTMTSNTRQAARSGAGGQDETVLPGVKNVVAVASGKGGVGKSTTAVNLALALRDQGAEVGLLDADVYGPSLSLLTGVHQRPDTTPDRKIMPVIGQGMKLMSMAFFMTDDSPVIWRGPMVHGLVKQFLTDVKWGELDYLIVDMPPGTGDAALTLTQMAPLSGAVIVTTANDLSLIDARKGLQMFEKVGVPILGIIENMAYFTPPDLPDRKYYLFGQGGGERVARELDVDFLGEVPIDPRIAEEGDLGRPIVSSQPDSPSSVALREISGVIARKLAMLAVKSPPVADANITWVS
ncbi:MAG: Mrp/NBP35 family ATP-binding protein, partial [bacterium]